MIVNATLRGDGVAHLELNRPEVRNAINVEMIQALHVQLDAWAVDDSVKCVVVSGAGGKAFAGGADIAELRDRTHKEGFWGVNQALFQKLEGLYFLYKYGNLDKAIWEARSSWAAGVIKLPFYRHWWAFEKTQNIWSAEFVAVIETARDTTNVVPWDVSALHGNLASAPEANPQNGASKS